MSAEPRVFIDSSLGMARYPEYFRADRGQIGDVMNRFAGLAPELIENIKIDFVRGDEADLPIQHPSPDVLKLSMMGISRARASGYLLVPDIWKELHGSNNLTAAAHYTLAVGIGRLKAAREVSAERYVRARSVGFAMLKSAGVGYMTYLATRSVPIGGASSLFTFEVSTMHSHNKTEAANYNKMLPIMNAFAGNEAVAQSLQGALDFEFRR